LLVQNSHTMDSRINYLSKVLLILILSGCSEMGTRFFCGAKRSRLKMTFLSHKETPHIYDGSGKLSPILYQTVFTEILGRRQHIVLKALFLQLFAVIINGRFRLKTAAEIELICGFVQAVHFNADALIPLLYQMFKYQI